MTRVFISYSHDSDVHRQRVLALSDRLRADGLDCQIDQYINGFPPEGWQRWMETQVEEADFVLLVCTPDYLKRFRGLETDGGRGVNFEGVVISQTLYDEYYRNTKFVPVMPDEGDLADVPLPLKGFSVFWMVSEYEGLYRFLTDQPLNIAQPLGERKNLSLTNTGGGKISRIHSDRLPTVKGKFFGRKAELQLLDDIWARNNTNIIQFIAPGGTGKTKLLRHWLDHTDDIEVLIAWSFYSQGSSEDKQTSASPFFSHVFRKLKATQTEFANDEEKGECLADLLCERRCVLVLDGLEPMQYVDAANRGELKDRALRGLLKSLARYNEGICIITTRVAVYELNDLRRVIAHDLHNLALNDGVLLLKSLGVKGKRLNIQNAVKDYGYHALALSLLGNVLRLRYQGHVEKRHLLKSLPVESKGSKESHHVFKVMQAYEEWFSGKPELALLHILGLFDHPIVMQELKVLWKARIANLTAEFNEAEWLEAVAALREEYRLLSLRDGNAELDCHPLIREYFGMQLKSQWPNAWQKAHETLYGYYKALPTKELPDTLEEMQPLFSAVAHGCTAGLQLSVLFDVYLTRIQRDHQYYLCNKLGALSDDLGLIACFFDVPWDIPSENLNESWQVSVLNWAGSRLRELGRLREALKPTMASVDKYKKLENWQFAAAAAFNLSELQLNLGQVTQAVRSGHMSVFYADLSADIFQQKVSRTIHGFSLQTLGKLNAASARYSEVALLMDKSSHSLDHFQFATLLLKLASGKQPQLELYEKSIINNDGGLDDGGLGKLAVGKVHLQKDNLLGATYWLDQAVDSLRLGGKQQFLLDGLFTRNTLHRKTKNFTLARRDLEEIYEIAEVSGMRLYLTDYHLEMIRLLLAEGKDSPQYHIRAAAKLIKETGYHRRDPELAELQQAINQSL